jgi:hypothetical protein
MPYFTPDDLNIDPSEFVDSCDSSEINELIEALVENGSIKPSEVIKKGVKRPNINDEVFLESLGTLAKCRDLLSITEEQFINNLAERFKYMR